MDNLSGKLTGSQSGLPAADRGHSAGGGSGGRSRFPWIRIVLISLLVYAAFVLYKCTHLDLGLEHRL